MLGLDAFQVIKDREGKSLCRIVVIFCIYRQRFLFDEITVELNQMSDRALIKTCVRGDSARRSS